MLQLPISICSVKATDAALEAVAAFPFKTVGIAETESLLFQEHSSQIAATR